MNLSSKTGYTNSVSLMVFHSVVGRGGRRKFQCDFGSKATCPIFFLESSFGDYGRLCNKMETLDLI